MGGMTASSPEKEEAPVFYPESEEEAFLEDDQSYMEYTVADDTSESQQQQHQQFYSRRADSFEEETFVEDDQSYMEFTVADDTPQRQQKQQRQQPVVPTISVEPDCDDDMTVLTFDESYMMYDTSFDKDDDKDTTATSVLRSASSDSQSMSSRSGHFSGTSVSGGTCRRVGLFGGMGRRLGRSRLGGCQV